MVGHARKFGPYLTVALLVPGGLVLAPRMWYARRHRAVPAQNTGA